MRGNAYVAHFDMDNVEKLRPVVSHFLELLD